MAGLEEITTNIEPAPSSEPNENECPICFESIKEDDLIELSCHHKFHKACLVTQMTFGNNKRVCAMCRITLPPLIELIPNYETDFAHCFARPQENPITSYGSIQGGATALHLACSQGHDTIVTMLLDHGAHMHAQVNDGKSVLHIAVLSQHLSTLTLLLDRGANIECRDNLGFTPLMAAALKGYEGALRILLDHGAAIDGLDNAGNTVLQLATLGGHESTLAMIVERQEQGEAGAVATE